MKTWLWASWLMLCDGSSRGWFDQRLYVEDVAQRPIVKQQLAALVHQHHLEDVPSADLIGLLGYSHLAAAWRQQVGQMPQKLAASAMLMTRRGNFGEVLLVDFMRHVLGVDVPVHRLRFNPNPNQAMKGDDGLGFSRGLDGDITRVTVGEAKYRTDKTPSSCKGAVDDAISSLVGGPKSMDFVATILDLQGEYDYAQQVRRARAQFANKAIGYQPVLVLLTLGQPNDPFLSIVSEPLVPQLAGLTAVSISFGDGIQDWLDELFEK